MRILVAALLLVSACTPEQKINTIDLSGPTPKLTPPACPDWTGQSSQTFTNDEPSNFRCATVNNFGQMVKDPMDLVEGKSSEVYPGSKTANAVRAYNGTAAASSSSSTSTTTSSSTSAE